LIATVSPLRLNPPDWVFHCANGCLTVDLHPSRDANIIAYSRLNRKTGIDPTP
jgi:hypothetical protein